MSPRYDWWSVQGIHPDKKDPYDVYINRFPTEAKANAMKASLMEQGYEHITITPPDYLKGLE